MIEIDLTTLQGWNDLPDGTYDITVGAKADGYTRIKQSEAVSVTKESPQEYFLTFSSTSSFTAEAPIISEYEGTIEYSTDKENWVQWDGSIINSGLDNKLYFRGSENTFLSYTSAFDDYGKIWSIVGNNISCTGDIETLLDYQTVANGQHPVMDEECYSDMFRDCTSLTTAPELPATTLANSCYREMFSMCESLTTAPALPATTLANSCYREMFSDCVNLTAIPAIQTTDFPKGCCFSMFANCGLLEVNTENDGYNEYRLPVSGTATASATGLPATQSFQNMFSGTLGDVIKPTVNTTYYTPNAIIMPDGTIIPPVQGE